MNKLFFLLMSMFLFASLSTFALERDVFIEENLSSKEVSKPIQNLKYDYTEVDKFVSSTSVEVKPSPLAQLTELAVKGKMSGVKQQPKNTYKTKKRQMEKDYQTRSSWF